MIANKITVPKQILLLLSLVIVLNIARIAVFESTYFLYMFWNIFLAILPFVISSILLWYANNKRLNRSLFLFLGIAWLLLLPNAPYIVTDLIHLGRNHSAPLLYDTFLLFGFAWVGLLLGFYSILHIEKILSSKYNPKKTYTIIAIIIFLTSFGIYLGRFLRFNTWDILTSHSMLMGNIWKVISNPLHYKDAYMFTGITFVFLYISYYAWKSGLKDNQTNV